MSSTLQISRLKRAEKLLDDVAAGTFGIHDAVSGAISAPTPHVIGRVNPYDRTSQDGI